MTKNKNVALVLASGGAKGFAHIGAIEELEARGYHITSVAGTSMGAMIGGLYAAGGLDKVKGWFYELDHSKIWSLLDFTWSINSMVKGDRLMAELQQMVPDQRIEDLRIPFCAVATDLKSGEEVLFDRGSLYDAIRASISLPMVFTQVKWGDRLLIDGGLVNGLPLNRVQRHEGDILVAVNLDDYDWKEQAVCRGKGSTLSPDFIFDVLQSRMSEMSNNYLSVMYRSLSISMKQNTMLALQLTPPDVYLNVDIGEYDSFDYDNAKDIAALGREQMAKVLDVYES